MSVSARIARVDPRRPYRLMAGGIRRIVLGGGAGADLVIGPGAHSNSIASAVSLEPTACASLPLRTSAQPARFLMAVVRSERGLLDKHAQQTLAATAMIADQSTAVVALVLGELQEDVAALGADQFVVLPQRDSGRFQPDRELACLQMMIARWRPAHVLLPDSDDGSGDLGRRLAAATGMSVATAVVELNSSGLTCYRRANTQFARRPLTDIVLLAPDVAETHLPFVGKGERVDLDASDWPGTCVVRAAARSKMRDLGSETIRASELALREADFIVAAGNGVGDIELLQKLAESLGAALGASRIVVDDGRVSRDRQIGATGQTVSAGLYMAFGISGAVQHLQGIKDCRHVVAVNVDPSAPIIQRADLSVIADADAMARALMAMIVARSGGRPGAGE